jgi:hypothetical protein
MLYTHVKSWEAQVREPQFGRFRESYKESSLSVGPYGMNRSSPHRQERGNGKKITCGKTCVKTCPQSTKVVLGADTG